MKRILQDEYKWYRVAFFAVFFMVIPSLAQSAWDSYWKHYYQTADISNFYVGVSLQGDNICYGDITQQINSIRYVYGTKTGWKAEVIRELFYDNNSMRIKVWEESATPFIEVKKDGMSSRVSTIPVKPVGLYHWEINFVKLYLPYGVERVDVPPLIGNGFAIEDCTDDV